MMISLKFLILTVAMKINLYEHQLDALERTKAFNKCAYYLDMGLGKTFVGSEKANTFNCKILIICQKSKLQDWINHYLLYYNYTAFDLTKSNQLNDYLLTATKCVGIINYELAWRRKDLLKLIDFTLMLDESSLISNEQAKRTKFILKLKPTNVILLSGTPISGKYEQLWSQCRLLGWNISKRDFWNKFIVTKKIDVGGFYKDIVIGYKRVSELKRRLFEFGAIFMKTDEVMTLPNQIEQRINVKASREYLRFKKHRYLMLNNGVELIGDNALTYLLYSRQLCGQYHVEKLAALKDIIDSTDDRLIIFYNFNEELNKIKALCLGRPISEVNGHIRNLKQYDDNDNSITLVQYQAGAMGLNLQKANKIIYFSLPLGKGSSNLWEQSKKRIHRIGQNRPCFYYYLLVDDSIEQSNIRLLEKGKELTDELFQATWQQKRILKTK